MKWLGLLALVLAIPFFFSVINFSLNLSHNTDAQNVEALGQVIQEGVTPTGIDLVPTLATMGLPGAILIIGIMLTW